MAVNTPEFKGFRPLVSVTPVAEILDGSNARPNPLAGSRASTADRRVDVSSVVRMISSECWNVGSASLKVANPKACWFGAMTNRIKYYYIPLSAGVLERTIAVNSYRDGRHSFHAPAHLMTSCSRDNLSSNGDSTALACFLTICGCLVMSQFEFFIHICTYAHDLAFLIRLFVDDL
jgi:hypothetical protein